MPSTIKCTQVGQNVTRMKGAFDESAVFIGKTFEVLSNEVWLSLEIFWRKSDAVDFCQINGFSSSLIRKVESRWQRGFAIGLGRDHYAPVCAQSRLVAHAMGCVVDSVEVSK